MTKTKKPDTITIDWSDFDEQGKNEELPKNAITVDMVRERYKIQNAAASRRMLKLVSSGLYKKGVALRNGKHISYIVKVSK